jgi:HlyD family secretion protein
MTLEEFMVKKNGKLIAILLIVALAVTGLLIYRRAMANESTQYRFATVERGDVKATVSATGTLGAVTTVSVGTQVSGRVTELFVDFNDVVKKGQLLARIDPLLAEQTVVDAQANLERAQAQYTQAQRQHTRNRELQNAGLVAASEYETTQSGLAVAASSVKSARVALDRARQNLSYTNIYAPIDGVVVERNVDIGQTVAASLSAPQLFLIANDLSQMQILAQVGESDIAQIKDGQPVQFTVQALQGQTFKGEVQQVRLQSATAENVVNYTVVVAVPNEDRKLLPGMTARVEFLTKNAENVLKVANSALRFKPSEEQLAKLNAARKTNVEKQASGARVSSPAAGGADAPAAPGTARRQRTPGAARPSFGTLYFVNEKGDLAVARVRTGITDGTTTEISGQSITEGMKVISGIATSAKTAESGPASPFGGAQQSGGGRRAPGGF